MGIGNLAEAQVDASRQELITPHGDRERTESSKPTLSRQSSLPLMGIGNMRMNEDDRQAQELITPHGDREPSLFRVSYTLDASETTPNTAVDLPICAWTPVWR